MADDVDETKKDHPYAKAARELAEHAMEVHKMFRDDSLGAFKMYRPPEGKPDSGMSPLGGKAK